jgi:LmbE family N-acetylglucosaminyl deacetylase
MSILTNRRAWLAVGVAFPLFVSASISPLLAAQVRAPAVGAVETGLLLRQLDGEKRVLMIGAHPDDEDASMLAALARGWGVTTAYLSLSRGEGGQNLIGGEVREGLGLLRTGELLTARSVDGGSQFFSRAFDFGFSKRAQEAFLHWPEEELVRDVTWVIRTFRPQVVLSVFTGTSRDGHGQHQAAGIATRRAFDVSGDSTVFPDQFELGVEPWEVLKLYQLNRFGSGTPTVDVHTGTLDPLLGRSYFQIAMESRSQHRSQDMGSPQSPGPRRSGATLITSRVSVGGEEQDSLFAGIDTTLVGLAAASGAPDRVLLFSHVAAYRAAIAVAQEVLHPTEPDRSLASLQDAWVELRAALAIASRAPEGPRRTEIIRVLEAREVTVSRAVLAASLVVVDVRVDRDRVVPGEEVGAQMLVWNGGGQRVAVEAVELELPSGWAQSRHGEATAALEPGELREWEFSVRIPTDADMSRPYFLQEEMDGDLYRWPQDGLVLGRAANPPLIHGRADISVGGGVPVKVVRYGSHVAVDQADGEYRLPIFVVPAASVSVQPGTVAWPEAETTPRVVSVRVSSLAQAELEGEVHLSAPPGWSITPEVQRVSLPNPGDETSYAFEVRPGDGVEPGRYRFRAVIRTGTQDYAEGVAFVDYPHIDPTPLFQPAEMTVSYFPVLVSDVRVGYIMGPGDGGAQALEALGVPVELLGPEEVRSGDLARFDTIVLGIRAYETRQDLRASNSRLLDFVRRGGTVISQYNQYQYPAGGFAPLRVEMTRPHDRVTDEEAVVRFLEPDHPVLSTPNLLSAEDFEGWVQERGLYFLSSWDEGYTPVLEMADPGEDPKQGSLLVTRLGDGAYVYTGLALFRQLPAGVSGAFRLLANLVSLRGSDLAPPL